MTLPTPPALTQWPPARWRPLFDMVAESAAWWEGEAKSLNAQYAGKMRPSQFAGGVVGATARFFWGKPNLPGQTQKKTHLPLPADIAATVASLLFDTPPSFEIAPDGGNDQASERLDLLLNNEQTASELLVAAESCSALGGVYGRIQWDTNLSPTPWIEWVDADAAVPEWTSGRLTAVTFVEELAPLDDEHIYRLASRYVPGRIEYTLHQGGQESADMGRTVPITDHPATAGLAPLMVDGNAVITGVDRVLATYIPNARPVVGFRRDGQLRHMGRPDLTPDLFELFDMLDETWTSLRRDLRLSRMRIVVPEYMLETGKPGQGAAFDVDREVYDTVHTPPSDGMEPQFYQPTIRVDEHLRVADKIIREVLNRVNISPLTFGMEDTAGGAVTAREIQARTRASRQTFHAKSRYWRAGLSELAESLLAVDTVLNNTGAEVTKPVEVNINPPEDETILDTAQTIQALAASDSISIEQRVIRANPDWTPEQVEEEVGKIQHELGLAEQADPFAGLLPDEPPTTD